MTSNRIYLDYAGAAIPTKELLNAIANSFIANDIVWANPHSSHELGQKSKALLQKSREKIFEYFGDKSSEFGVVFTANATASLKLLAETFNSTNNAEEYTGRRELSNDLNKLTDCSKSTLLILNDSHTSVVGMRQIGQFEQILVTEFEQLKTFLNELKKNNKREKEMKCKESLFVMTAMSNFCGRIYDLEIANLLKQTIGNHWKICFDAATLAPSSPNIGLSICDFVVISFYKMFGYPTGLGALLIRRNCANLLKKKYFGGGTINYSSNSSLDVHFRDDISERFEDGTPNICAIQSLLLAFKSEISTNSSMEIAEEAFDLLTNLKHQNGNSLAIIYGKGWAEYKRNETKLVQGPIVNFNLLRDDGSVVGFVEMGKKCGDEVDLIEGKPIGSVRISLGKNSTKQDLLVFRQMLECCFLCPTIGFGQTFQNNINLPSIGFMTHLFIYPIKSCSAISKESWPICPNSFTLLHDRRWVIANKNTGEWITQKRYPSICSIQVELSPKELILNDRHNLFGTQPLRLPILPAEVILDNDRQNNNNGILCSNGSSMSRLENFGGNAASIWLEQLDPSLENCELKSTMNTKIKVERNRGNFSNQADFLLITHTSAKFIAETLQMSLRNVIERFRPNFVVDFGQNWKPFQEERIKRISIGSLKFKVVGLCQRCQMICIDQTNGEKDPNVLIGLRNMRIGEKKPMVFGVYLELEHSSDDDVFIGQRELHTKCTVRLLE